jgi:hypothetical protein
MMKRKTLLIAIIIPLSLSSSVLARDAVVSDPPMPAASETRQSISQNPDTQMPMHAGQGMGMKHHGKCKHGNGGGGKKHDSNHDKDRHNKHADVVRRLDRIEARMARIEAMLYAMMRR